jgi:methionine synthase II (cobalamin-independent)
VEAAVVEQELAAVIAGVQAAVPYPVVVHCCATRAPIELFRAAGADGVSLDAGLVQDLDALGTAVEAGTHLLLGIVPGTDAPVPAPKASASRISALWNELGFPAERLAEAVTLTPACGLAGATPSYARTAMAHVRQAAEFFQPG